jgi:hypothetical protein
MYLCVWGIRIYALVDVSFVWAELIQFVTIDGEWEYRASKHKSEGTNSKINTTFNPKYNVPLKASSPNFLAFNNG